MRATNIPQVLLRKKSRFVLCVRRFRSLFVYLQRTAVWRCIVLSVLHAFCGASDRERVPMCGVSGYVCGVVLNAEAAAASPRTATAVTAPKPVRRRYCALCARHALVMTLSLCVGVASIGSNVDATQNRAQRQPNHRYLAPGAFEDVSRTQLRIPLLTLTLAACCADARHGAV